MSTETGNPFDRLERLFHEPNRLAIMAAVCDSDKGMTFSDLKEACNLTDGNLNRHLKVLEEAGAVTVRKAFVKDRPRTTIKLSRKGLQDFSGYLAALSDVLDTARTALSSEKGEKTVPAGKTVPA